MSQPGTEEHDEERSPTARVWLLVAGLAAAGAALYLAGRSYPALAAPHLNWWEIALGFIVAEACVVHLTFRQGSHSLSLADVPFVFGLILASGQDLLVGALVGTAAVFAYRRQPAIKFLFNLAQLAFVTTTAVIVIHLIAPHPGAVGPAMWLGAYAATQVSGVLTILCLATVISMTEGWIGWSTLVRMLGTDVIVTSTNASLAIAATLVVSTDVRAIPLLTIPVVTAFILYRAYVLERQRHERLEFLYEANRTLARSPEVAEALDGLLGRSLEAFRCELAEITLFSSDGGPALRTTLGARAEHQTMVAADPRVARALRELASGEHPVVPLLPPYEDPALRTHLEALGVRHAMVAMLPGEERPIGTIMLANRPGVVRSFSADDMRLLEALANNASVALQYDRLEQAVGQLRDLQEQLHHQAYHDHLTGLPNRALFMEQVRLALAGEGSGDGHAVLFVDVDDFKTVNDSLGHATGDALLVAVAIRLRQCVRPGDIVARLGGDEFALLLPRSGDADAAGRNVAERIMRAFDLPVPAGNELLSVHVSVGIATDGQTGDDGDELIRNADLAMYQAKEAGKGRYVSFDPAMADAVLRRHVLKEELRKAIRNEELVLHYQPIVSIATGEICGAESLVRWMHPARGMVSPAEFIPLAEETGLIVPMGRLILREACRQVSVWQRLHGPAVQRMHVNVSGVELLDPTLTERVKAALADFELDPQQLVIEITETQLLQDPVMSAARFQELRDLGIRIALDDFGTGYSSLSYLHNLPLDILKIAKPFVDALGSGGPEASFARTIIDLASTLGLEVIAEGIETQDQLDVLRELACDMGQGFLMAGPAPLLEDEVTFRPVWSSPSSSSSSPSPSV